LSSTELEKLIGKRDYTDFQNTRNETFRRKKMKDNPPTRREAIRMMSKEPNLIRRPVIVAGGRVVVGFDENGMARL
jgi:arsenate reductase-like glutaredoxin family protein